ncbi:MAG: hypothetical protein ACKO24_18520 [Leptolyngbyaceae cyanobacterium]
MQSAFSTFFAGRAKYSNFPRDWIIEPVGWSLGLEAGISSLVTLSTGETVANSKRFDRAPKRFRQAQKALT